QSLIFLDLRRDGYDAVEVLGAAEFAISVAATLAARLIEQRQEVGLATNGLVPLPPEEEGAGIAPTEMTSPIPRLTAHGTDHGSARASILRLKAHGMDGT